MSFSSQAPADTGADLRVRTADRGADLRLLVAAACGWLAVLWGISRGTTTVLVVCGLAAIAGIVALRSSHRFALPVSLGALSIVLMLVPLAGRQYHWQSSTLHQLAVHKEQVRIELTSAGDPNTLSARGPDGLPRVAVAAKARRLVRQDGVQAVSGTVLVLASAAGWQDVLPGQRLILNGTLSLPMQSGELAVTVFAQDAPLLIGRTPWYQRAAGSVRASLRQACAGLPGQVRGLLPGLIDGDTSNLDPVLEEHFRLAGLTHLVAVSGSIAC